MKPALLFYVGQATDLQKTAVAPVLAAAAERAGWGFECYYDRLRRGRHFGAGDPDAAPPGWAGGSLVAGGRHGDQVLWLSVHYQLVALGDPGSVLWPALRAAGAEVLAASSDPAVLYPAAFERLRQPIPAAVLVIDARPQGPRGLVVAPYLYPAIFSDRPTLAVDVSSDDALRRGIEGLGATEFRGLYVEPDRGAAFPGGLDATEGEVGEHTYSSLSTSLAKRHAPWGRGVLLGDPELVAAQLPKARRLRLVPLYGRPQTEVIRRARDAVRVAREPIFGRQYDDRDFFALSRLGRGFQLVDPSPPFDAMAAAKAPPPDPSPAPGDPGTPPLERWAADGRVLATVLFWAGMVRELDCLPRLIDLVATTGLRAGLVITAETIGHDAGGLLPLLASPPERGGALGLLEVLLASTGRGVAAESTLPDGALAASLEEARAVAVSTLPDVVAPSGWWPLMDASLVPHRPSRLGWRNGRPIMRFTPRGAGTEEGGREASTSRRDLRALGGALMRRSKLVDSLFVPRRPFEHFRPGRLDQRVAEAVAGAGFSYMWTKSRFGAPAVPYRRDDFVALNFTAGNWDGWSPFITIGSAVDVLRAEQRLVRGRSPGWLASTIDSPLWALSGELLEKGGELYRIAEVVARGGRSGRLLNAGPSTIAAYARLLELRGLVPGPRSDRR